jgi:acyl-CoA dehydrogenase
VTDPFTTPERELLRETARQFVEREVLPHLDRWEREGLLPRSLHRAAAEAGLLGIGFPESVGGGGGDIVDSATCTEEFLVAGASGGLVAGLFTGGIALPHIVAAGDLRQIDRWVRPTLAGEKIGALAVTEPNTGSDLARLHTTATLEGDHYVVNGAKTYITSGYRADFVTAAVRTGGPGAGGVSLLVIERDTPGFVVSRPLEKMGWHSSDTAELAFGDCRVPARNLVGEPGTGFAQLARHFQSERLLLAVQAYAAAQRCLDLALYWSRARTTFGKPLIERQLVRHTLVEMARRTDVARAYVRQVAARLAAGEDVVAEVCFAKNTAVEVAEWVVDRALQLHGGFGYMREAEVERQYRDVRVLGIGGGASEVLSELAARALGFTQ